MRKMRYGGSLYQGRRWHFYLLRRRNETAGAETAPLLGLMIFNQPIQIIESEKPFYKKGSGFPVPR
jgi:hypothetical protein